MKTYPTMKEIIHREWGLILFTTLIPTSVGVIMVGIISDSPVELGVLAVILAALGLLASVGHLARPIRAPFAVRHLSSSWLSREILASIFYFFLCVSWGLNAWMGSDLTFYSGIASLAMAFILFIIMGRSYQVWARPAWNGPEVFFEIVSISLLAGIPAGELSLIFGKSIDYHGWLGIGGLTLGLAILWWVTGYRFHRLKNLPTGRLNAQDSLAQRIRLEPYFRIMLLLGFIGLLAALVAMTTDLDAIAWSVAVVIGLTSQLFSRTLFYALPIQRRYAVSLSAIRQIWIDLDQ